MTHAGVSHLPVGARPRADRRLRIGDVMRPAVYAVAPDTPVTAAASLVATTGCSGVPVVGPGGRVVGLVTEADLVGHQLRSARTAPPAVVGEVMSAEPLLAPRNHDLDAVIGLMLAAGVPVMPIVDGRRLAGMVDLRDLVRIAGGTSGRVPDARRASG